MVQAIGMTDPSRYCAALAPTMAAVVICRQLSMEDADPAMLGYGVIAPA